MQSHKIFYLFSLFVCVSCNTTPEDPTLMDLLVGSYKTSFVDIRMNNQESFIELERDSHLTIKSDYSYTLSLLIPIPNSDSVIIIQQEGTFNIPKYRYDKNCGEALCFPKFEGEIWFYPENSNKWGGTFYYSKINKAWGFHNRSVIYNMDGMIIYAMNWDKINSEKI